MDKLGLGPLNSLGHGAQAGAGPHPTSLGLHGTSPGVHGISRGLNSTSPGLHGISRGLHGTGPGLHSISRGLPCNIPGLHGTSRGAERSVSPEEFDNVARASSLSPVERTVPIVRADGFSPAARGANTADTVDWSSRPARQHHVRNAGPRSLAVGGPVLQGPASRGDSPQVQRSVQPGGKAPKFPSEAELQLYVDSHSQRASPRHQLHVDTSSERASPRHQLHVDTSSERASPRHQLHVTLAVSVPLPNSGTPPSASVAPPCDTCGRETDHWFSPAAASGRRQELWDGQRFKDKVVSSEQWNRGSHVVSDGARRSTTSDVSENVALCTSPDPHDTSRSDVSTESAEALCPGRTAELKLCSRLTPMYSQSTDVFVAPRMRAGRRADAQRPLSTGSVELVRF